MAFDFQLLGRFQGGAGSLLPGWVAIYQPALNPLQRGRGPGRAEHPLVGGTEAEPREAKPGTGKTRAPRAGVCLFKCHGLRSRPGALSRIYNPVPPASALVARLARAGAAVSGKPNYLLLLSFQCPTFPEICVRGLAAASVNRRCPPPPPSSSLGALRSRGGRRGRNASFPAAQLRCGPRRERRQCGAHTCKLALEVSGAAGCPSRSPRTTSSPPVSRRR